MKLSVVMPVCNEAGILENSLRETERNLRSLSYPYEIILAEDGSTDGSGRLCRKLASGNRRVRCLHSDRKLGRGKALKNSFRESSGNVLVYFDVDLATDLSSLGKLLEEVGKSDICIGSRFMPGSRTERSLYREIASRSYNLLAKILFGTKVSDLQCGFKAFHRETLPVLLGSRDNGWFWDTETLLLAEMKGLEIREVPVKWREGRCSKVNVIKDSVSMGLRLVMLRLRIFLHSS